MASFGGELMPEPEKCPACGETNVAYRAGKTGLGFTCGYAVAAGRSIAGCNRAAELVADLRRQLAALNERAEKAEATLALRADPNHPFLHCRACEKPALAVTCLNCEEAKFEERYAEINALRGHLRSREAEIRRMEIVHERLQSIVDKLPRTADGVPVAPLDTIYYLGPAKPCGCREVLSLVVDTAEKGMMRKFGHMNGHLLRTADAYSTRQAAGEAERRS